TTSEEGFQFAFVLDERFLSAPLGAEQRRLRDVNVSPVDELAHLPVEEREQKRTDVRSVDVGVRHDDDAVIAQFRDVELVGSDATAKRGDQRADLLVAEHFVETRLLDVEDLALDGQNSLDLAVAPLFG